MTGTGGIGSFQITTTGGTGSYSLPNLNISSTYDITETPKAGWDETASTSCSGISLTAGATSTCAITNTVTQSPPAPTLTIVKHTVGGDGTFHFSTTGQTSTSVDLTTVNGFATSTTITLGVGTTTVSEASQAGWDFTTSDCVYEGNSIGQVTALGSEDINVDAGDSVVCTFTNTKQSAPPETATASVIATKIVCDHESDLPNWGAGDGGDITASTVSTFLSEHEGECRVASDWTFQWSAHGTEGPWTDSNPTGESGTTTVEIPSDQGSITFREVTQEGFIPFSGWQLGETAPSEGGSVSAEMYCHTDHLNYDNNDRVDDVTNGETYYCVAFNAREEGAEEEESGSDLSITKAVDETTPDAGQTITYTITVHNDGPNDATNVIVTDVLPAGVEYVSTDGGESYATSTGKWTVGALANDASKSLTIVVRVTGEAGQSIENSASVSNENQNASEADDNATNNVSAVSFTVHTPGHTSGGRNSSGSRPSSSGQVLGVSTSTPQVLGVSCGLYMDQHLREGSAKNNADQVTKLQAFLNKRGFVTFAPTGFFGPLTTAGVNAFQVKYTDEILKPWSISLPTGLVYLTTLRQINLLECPDLTIPLPKLVPWVN